MKVVDLPIADKSIEITNNQQGLAKLLSCCVEYYQHLSDIIIAFEPTGGYERELKEFLKLNKVNFVTVHPNKVRSYAKAKGWLAKTDLIDSKLQNLRYEQKSDKLGSIISAK